jgi:DNA end-binding protein Ku
VSFDVHGIGVSCRWPAGIAPCFELDWADARLPRGPSREETMARALWKGSISFGLVNIPIELHTAVRDNRPRFRMLHAKDRSPIRFERVCAKDGTPVAWDDLVKGYEYEKGRFVVLTKEDFQAAALEKSRTVDILDFVDAEAIDDRYFETPYYVLPAKGGERAYALLREAIRTSDRIGIAKIILRETQHLAALQVIGEALVLTMMRFADELVDVSTFSFPAASSIRSQELDMAKMLVENLAADWSPEKYTDEYRDNLMKVIRAKMKGKKPELTAEVEPQSAEVVDLMERLRRSLEGGGAKGGAKKKTAKKTKAASKSARKRTAA